MATPGDFTVTFEFNQVPRKVRTPDHEQWTFEDLKEGFWVMQDMRICRMSQGQYFIPASRIVLIERS
jgi:hypothetical protein